MKNLPAVKEGDAAVPDPLLLALKMEEEGHEPKNGSGFWNLGMTVILQSAREQGPQFSPAGNYSASKKELGSGFLFMASRLAVNPGDTLISAF